VLIAEAFIEGMGIIALQGCCYQQSLAFAGAGPFLHGGDKPHLQN
jgi:hypothetical protein